MNVRKILMPALLSFAFLACDDIPNEVIENDVNEILLTEITLPESVDYTEDQSSEFITSLEFKDTEGIKSVYCNIGLKDETYTLAKEKALFNDGSEQYSGDKSATDNIYTAKIVLDDNSIPNGEYVVEYYVNSSRDDAKKIGVKQFAINKIFPNQAPVIEKVMVPDTVIVQDPKSIIPLRVEVSDINGLSDIKTVYFTMTKPDGTSNNIPFALFDDGDKTLHGDEVANDGIYSLVIQITPQNDKGKYRFDFQASDRSDSLSKIVSHYIHIL